MKTNFSPKEIFFFSLPSAYYSKTKSYDSINKILIKILEHFFGREIIEKSSYFKLKEEKEINISFVQYTFDFLVNFKASKSPYSGLIEGKAFGDFNVLKNTLNKKVFLVQINYNEE
jgi:hypothetical protein